MSFNVAMLTTGQIESAAKPELHELNDLSVQSGDTITSERQQECGQCDGQEHVEEQAEHEGKGGDDTNKGQRHRGCGDQLLPSSFLLHKSRKASLRVQCT